MNDYGPSPEELAAICAQVGCVLVRAYTTASGAAYQIDCPTHRHKVALLDALASYDAGRPELRGIVEAVAFKVGPDPAALARAFLELVQRAVRYTGEVVETFAPAARTLLDTKIGDCDDMCRALLALLRAAAIPARLALFGDPPDQPRHVSIEAHVGGAWRWLEPTIAAWPGEHPYAAARRLGIPI